MTFLCLKDTKQLFPFLRGKLVQSLRVEGFFSEKDNNFMERSSS